MAIADSSNPHDTLARAFERNQAVVRASVEHVLPAAATAATVLLEAFSSGRHIFICGNGGSAADSHHFAAEWIGRYQDDRDPLPAIALTTDTSALTAISNDYHFRDVFSRQIRALGREGDVLIALTTSGKSENVLEALRAARAKRLRTIALTGSRGRNLETLCDIAIVVPTEETARIQEVHKLVLHSWCEFVDGAWRRRTA